MVKQMIKNGESPAHNHYSRNTNFKISISLLYIYGLHDVYSQVGILMICHSRMSPVLLFRLHLSYRKHLSLHVNFTEIGYLVSNHSKYTHLPYTTIGMHISTRIQKCGRQLIL